MAAVTVSAAVLAIAYTGGKNDKKRGARPVTGQGPGATQGSAKAKPGLPPRPIRFKASRDGGALEPLPMMGASAAFERQERDDEWADAMEDEVEQIVKKLLLAARGGDGAAVTVRELECRSTSCRIIVGGAEPDAVRQFLESLQDSRGFYERADALSLERRGGKRNEQPTEVGVFIKYQRQAQP
jgi:hypothetical protein